MFPIKGTSKDSRASSRRHILRFALGSLLASTALVLGTYTPASAQMLSVSALGEGGGDWSSATVGSDCSGGGVMC